MAKMRKRPAAESAQHDENIKVAGRGTNSTTIEAE